LAALALRLVGAVDPLVGLLLAERRGAPQRAVAAAGDAPGPRPLADVRAGPGAALDEPFGHQHLAGLQRDRVGHAVGGADAGLRGQPGVRRQGAVRDLLTKIVRDSEIRGLLTERHRPLQKLSGKSSKQQQLDDTGSPIAIRGQLFTRSDDWRY